MLPDQARLPMIVSDAVKKAECFVTGPPIPPDASAEQLQGLVQAYKELCETLIPALRGATAAIGGLRVLADDAMRTARKHFQAKMDKMAKKSAAHRAALEAKAEHATGEWERAQQAFEELQARVQEEGRLIEVIELHAKNEKPIPGCACVACKMLQRIVDKDKAFQELKKEKREIYEQLKSFRGPVSKKK